MDTSTLEDPRPGIEGRIWVGPVGSGKTAALVEWARHLVDEGADVGDIVFLASTPSAVAAARKRLADAGVSGATVSTLSDLLVERLGRPEIRELTGRVPRVLEDFEEHILDEDMKVTGIKPKRLKEMLKFFYRTFTELGDESDDFIVEPEERVVDAALREHLRCREAMLRPELSNVAYKLLRDHPEVRDLVGAPHVLVDDFQNLNRASQLVAEQLAGESFAVAGNPDEQIATSEPYPWKAGLDEVATRYGSAAVCELTEPRGVPADVASVANSLVARDSFASYRLAASAEGAAPAAMQCVKWTYPNDEFRGVAAYIADRLAAEPELRPRDFFVVAPNALWARALARVLDAHHIAADVVVSANRLAGDPRKDDRNGGLRAFTALNLVASPEDGAAWRSWCGFGDYLTRSNHWCRLEEFACERALRVSDALALIADLEDEPFAGAACLADRYRAGRALIDKARGTRGFTLLAACCEPDIDDKSWEAFLAMLGSVTGTESAEELWAQARSRMESAFSDADAVRIGLIESPCGLSFDTVIITGAVEGFWPSFKSIDLTCDDDVREALQDGERRAWYSALGKARRHVVISTVQKDESNTAAALGMWVHRIRMENGASMATLAPTTYLDEMGPDLPPFEGSLTV